MMLDTSASVVLDGSGNGTASAGPQVAEYWDGISVAVSVATNTAEAQCSLYLGSGTGSAGELLGQTATGSSGDTYQDAGGDLQVQLGQKLIARWTGGDPGARATMSVFGTKTPH